LGTVAGNRPVRLTAGTTVGRYEIVGQLGAGGMAVVYRARDQELGRDVALKILNSVEDSAQGNTRLLREAQALAQLAHPNVIHIYDVGRFADGVFLAMELVEGERLDEWIREKERGVREVLPIFRDAARGLFAAHQRGIVHRDFKPSNLILGRDGRIRVLDFGLARAADPEGRASITDKPRDTDNEKTSTDPITETTSPVIVEENAPQKPMEMSSSKSLLDSPLTQEGALVGTPPYMAPEQHAGRCDARSDQFSFCVAFWLALYGERPFTGLNYDDLKNNMAAGRIRPPPGGKRVPAWLQRVLLRGLSPRPEDRFPDMNALVHALGQDPAARRRRVGIIIGVALLGVVGAFGWWRGPAQCRDAQHRLQGVWDAARKQQVQATFAATKLSFAEDAYRATAAALDAWAQRWSALNDQVCQERGERSNELFDLRMECLGARLDDFRAKVEVFAAADAEVVTSAPSAAANLPSLAGCNDSEALRAPVRVPAETRRRVEALRRELARVRALWESGRATQAARPAEEAAARAKDLAYRPIEAEALLLRGRVEEATGRYPAAERSLRDARVAAEAGRVDETAARASTALMWVVGGRQGRHAEAHELAREVEAKLERVGHNEILIAELQSKLSTILLEEGKFEEALARAARAVELRERSLAPTHPALAAAIGDRADVLQQLARYDAAIADYQRALEIVQQAYGGQHPAVASLLINQGNALRLSRRHPEALERYRRAEKILLAAFGPQHPQLATVAVNLGGVAVEMGDLERAVNDLVRARALWQKALGADHPNVATVEFRLGEVAMKRGRPAEAAAQFELALASWEKKLGPEHPSLSAALSGLGDALLAQKKPVEAAARYRRALTILEKAVGPDHPDTRELREALSRAAKFR
jgi:tetratricopeptide (TPR) repeat protein/predicted Ser/Thr protein kinase